MTPKPSKIRCTIGSFICLLVLGCDHGPPMGEVSGTITLDGQPVEEGTIRFVPLDEKTATAGGVIKQGKFLVRAPVNKHRIEISYPQLPPGGIPKRLSNVEFVIKELVPDRYNRNSELILDVPVGASQVKYELKTH